MTRLTRVLPATHDEAPLPDVDMSAALGPLTLPDPVMTASGCAGYGRELDPYLSLAGLGAVVTKSIMLKPRAGRPTPRMAETPSGMLNSIGLQGSGVDTFVERDLAWLESRGARAIVSIAGNDVEEFGRLAAKLRHSSAVKGIEVNISCPNVANQGLVFARDPQASADVVSLVRRNTASGVPVIAKLSPDVTDIVEIAAACVDAGADALCLINTVLGLVIDVDELRPHLAGVTGGLSGPAIRPIAVRAVWQVHQALPEVPLVGVGGVRTGRDALEFLAAGASAIQVGTAIFNDPSAPQRVSRELQRLLHAHGMRSAGEAIGVAHRNLPDAAPAVSAAAPAAAPAADDDVIGLVDAGDTFVSDDDSGTEQVMGMKVEVKGARRGKRPSGEPS